MVAQGLGVMLLPDFSVAGDPLEQAGLIVRRPLAEPSPRVRLVLVDSSSSSAAPAPFPVRRVHCARR